MPIVPKTAAASNVTPIKQGRRGGRASVGYDPENKEESYARGSQQEYNALALNTGSAYREDRFYTRSVDKHGHGEKLSLRVPQGIDSQMHKAVADIIEYNTLNDLVRDAVMHRLEYLQHRYSIGGDMLEQLEIERLRADGQRENKAVAEHEAAVEELRESFQLVWDAQDIEVLAKKLENASMLVDLLREPYRGKTKELLRVWRTRSKPAIAEMRARLADESL